jgi:hypothetical protein
VREKFCCVFDKFAFGLTILDFQGILNSLATGYAVAGMLTGDCSAAAIALPFHPARFQRRES